MCFAVAAMRPAPMLPHLALLQLLVQLFLQRDDVQARRGRAGHILHPQLPFLGPFPARWRALASKASPSALAPVPRARVQDATRTWVAK